MKEIGKMIKKKEKEFIITNNVKEGKGFLIKIMLNLSEGFWKNDKKIGEEYQIRNYSIKMNKNCKLIEIIRNKILIYRAKNNIN